MLALDENVKKSLTTQECAALAGGFGVSDDDVAALFLVSLDSDVEDKVAFETSRKVAFNGLVHSIRAGDSKTARQVRLDKQWQQLHNPPTYTRNCNSILEY